MITIRQENEPYEVKSTFILTMNHKELDALLDAVCIGETTVDLTLRAKDKAMRNAPSLDERCRIFNDISTLRDKQKALATFKKALTMMDQAFEN